jgi:tetratricopeptide (TPR) repeat protein
MSKSSLHFLAAVGRTEEAELIRAGLKRLGFHHVTHAANGPAAANEIQKNDHLFVFAAWELPQLGGLRFSKMLRHRPESKDWPLVLIVPAHHDSETEMVQSQSVQVTAFLSRPLTEAAVADLTADILAGDQRLVWPAEKEKQADQEAEAGRLQEALSLYNDAAAQGRRVVAGLHADAGVVELKLGRFNEALEHFERAALMDPRSGRIQTFLAKAYHQAGLLGQAQRAFERAVALSPEDRRTQEELAETLLEMDKPDLAERLIAKLLPQRPKDPFLLNKMGIALRKQKKYQEALHLYKEAIQLLDQDENLYFNLGRCYFELGYMGQAAAAVNQALNINPKMEHARRFLARIPQL